MSGDYLMSAALRFSNQNLRESKDLTAFELYEDLKQNLIPTINSISMIAQMIEQQALGPVDLGPYKDYIQALKECAEIQEQFSQNLASYLSTPV